MALRRGVMRYQSGTKDVVPIMRPGWTNPQDVPTTAAVWAKSTPGQTYLNWQETLQDPAERARWNVQNTPETIKQAARDTAIDYGQATGQLPQNLENYRGYNRGGADVAGLRRGIAHYAEGEASVPLSKTVGDLFNVQQRPAPVPVVPVQSAPLPDVLPPQPAPADLPPVPQQRPSEAYPTPIRQLLFGHDFAGVAQNPEASSFTSSLAGFLDHINRNVRVQNLENIRPSPWERTVNFFGGDARSRADINRRDATADALTDPLVQQHLLNNPDVLAEAEQDPHGFGDRTKDPVFRQQMQQAQAIHDTLKTNSKVDFDERPKVVKTVLSTGAHPDAAHASIATHKYTRDEFIKATEGVPFQILEKLFANELRVPTIQERVANEYFGGLKKNVADLEARIAAENNKYQKNELIKKRDKAKEFLDTQMGTYIKSFSPLPGVGQ